MKKNNPQTTKEFFMKRIFSLLLILSALVMTFSGCGLFEPGNASLEENKIESDHDDATGGEDLIDCNGDSDDTPTTSGNNLVFFGTIEGFNRPYKMAVADDKLYVSDNQDHQVKIYSNLAGIPNLERTIGVTGTIKTDDSGFNQPHGMAVAGGKLYVADFLNHRVQVYNLPIVDNDEADATIGTGTIETDNSGFNQPNGLAAANGRLYVAEHGGNHRVQIYNNLSGTPTYERTLGTTGVTQTDNSGFNKPTGMVIANGRLYVTDMATIIACRFIIIYRERLPYERTLGAGLNSPHGIEIANGRLYVTDIQQ